jgi:radical SAM superfamily enzyme YgiQ (UPF0313 family)
MLSPDQPLRCLLVQPKFSSLNYWNYIDSAKLIDAKTPAPPLGLLTVAALLPQNWEFRLLDLNVRAATEEDWAWAELVCTGGMLPQQPGILQVIEESQKRGKMVAVGGADPSSQPAVYRHSDVLVEGEGEIGIPMWMDAWRKGNGLGHFKACEKPDVTKSPTPRYDLVDFNHYVHVGVQISRGCPFNCEFCDIIELYGRKPRLKEAPQFLAELEKLYQLGYRGWVDIVDDNFIGNKRAIKKILVELKEWSKARSYPFYFSTEASMNLADDENLMALMRDVDFRFVFMGIETPDPAILMTTQKSQNTIRPITDRVQRVYKYGMLVSAGYILGFDAEKTGMDRAMIKCIEETGTIMAMVGLLTALPNTQLTRRLQKEGRLISPDLKIVGPSDTPYVVATSKSYAEDADQTTGGLNYVTLRDRVEIFNEYLSVINTIYDPKIFMNRILKTVWKLRPKQKHFAHGWELKRNLKGLWRMMKWATRHPEFGYYFWRNFFVTLLMGRQRFEMALTMSTMYMHIEKQTMHLRKQIGSRRDSAFDETICPRQIVEPVVAQPA